MTKQKEIKKITDAIAKKYKPEKIILFGSYAWGKPTKDSDVDLFVVKETKNTRKLAREIDDLLFPRLFPLDIIINTPIQVEERKKWVTFLLRIFSLKAKFFMQSN